MSYEFDSNAEYLEVNRSLILDITNAIDSYLDTAQAIPTLIITPDNDNPTFVSGAATAEEITKEAAELGTNLTFEEAYDIAQTHNRSLMGRAALSTLELQTAVTKRYITDCYCEDPVTVRTEPLELIPFTHAVYKILHERHIDGTVVSLGRTTLNGLQRYNQASEHVIETEEDGVTQKTSFLSIERQPLFVFSRTDLSYDPLLYRAVILLDKSKPELGLLMSGSLCTEEEIGDVLAKVEQQYHGSSKEGEVGPILDELFERAMSLQANYEMLSNYNFSTPNIEQLEALRTLLAN